MTAIGVIGSVLTAKTAREFIERQRAANLWEEETKLNDDKLSEAEYREAERVKNLHAPERENACNVTWGNCDERNPVYFGKPTATPHVCKGGRKHGSKLHACENCGCVGAVHQPLAFTKAGQQLRTLVLAEARHQALQKAKIYMESKVREAEQA